MSQIVKSDVYQLDIEPATKRVRNPRMHGFMPVFGVETLQHWFSLFAKNSNTVASGDGYIKKLVLSGDSVTFGYNNTTGVPANILKIIGPRRGYKNVQVINRGQSGKACFQWAQQQPGEPDYLQDDINLSPDLLVLGWGDNDFGLGRTEAQLLADYRAGLTKIRAQKSVSQLSIILRTPTSMTDVIHNRTEGRIENVIDGFKQLARDFDCAFIDVYSICQNSHKGAGLWMDNDQGQAIHPLDVLQEHVWGAVADLVFPVYGGDWQNNGIYNYSAASEVRGSDDAPFTFFDGVTMVRSGQGTPYDGILVNIKQADSAALQLNIPLFATTAGYGIAARLGFNNGYGPWLGKLNTFVPQNNWVQQAGSAPVGYYVSLEGELRLQGLIGGGVKDNSTIITQLPDGFRPKGDHIVLIATSVGFARVKVDAAGLVKIYDVPAGVDYISLDGVRFKISP